MSSVPPGYLSLWVSSDEDRREISPPPRSCLSFAKSPPILRAPPPTPSATPVPQSGATTIVCDKCNGAGTLPSPTPTPLLIPQQGVTTHFELEADDRTVGVTGARETSPPPPVASEGVHTPEDDWRRRAHAHVLIGLGVTSAPNSPDLLHVRDPSSPNMDVAIPPSASVQPISPSLLPMHPVSPAHSSQGLMLPHHVYADRAFIIGVAGGTASGKTSLCAQILKSLEVYQTRVAIVAQDSFYKTLTDEERRNVAAKNFDEPAAFDWELMKEVLTKLRHKKKTEIPIYDYCTHSRRTDKTVSLFAQDVILFEGILAFHNEGSVDLRSLMDLAIFVETDNDTRLARRVVRDIQERGRQLDNVLYQYEKFVKPAFEEWVEPQKRMADVIIPWGEYSKNNICVDLSKGEWQAQHYPALDMIVEHIRTKLPNIPTRGKKMNRSGTNIPTQASEKE
ncbi:uridine kinase [Pelomyxa schiedti]|nr:uridine kinase [Pelomyxa schiedti]